jgi:plasmid segregation protein ParM
MKSMIIGVDPGNANIKVVGKYGALKMVSDIGEYRDRKLQDQHGPDDVIFEYRGQKGFAGTLAKYESELGGSIMGMTKAHNDTVIRTLIALHRYCKENEFRIVTNQPIEMHTPEEKESIKRKLIGSHEIIVNRIHKVIHIHEVEVAAEGGAAFWSQPRRGLYRVIDIGGGTINYATLLDGKYIDKGSGTLDFGSETTKAKDPAQFSRAVAANLLKIWDRDDPVGVAGGIAEKLIMPLKDHFRSAQTIRPQLKTANGKTETLAPIFANAAGNYQMGLRIYE